MSYSPPKKKLKQLNITSFFGNTSSRSDTTMESNECQQKTAKNIDKIIKMHNTDGLVETTNEEQLDTKLLVHDSILISNFKVKDEEYLTNSVPSSTEKKENVNGNDYLESYKGYPLDSFAKLFRDNPCFPNIEASDIHEVFVKLPLAENGVPEPDTQNEDMWDDVHVRMPNSPQSLYHNVMNNNTLVLRWAVICEAFSKKITSVEQLLKAILSYNHRYKQKWSFYGLLILLETEFCKEEHDFFFNSVLPGIIRLALALPSIIQKPIPLLTRGKTQSLSLSQKQVASLLANAFLCTFPRRNVKGPHAEYSSYPDINFNRLFNHQDKIVYEKLKGIINYFKEITSKEPDGMITFTRHCVVKEYLPPFTQSSNVLSQLHIDSKGLIEEADGFLQVDFANKYIGGGIFGFGCVQEEIRFVMYPELIATRIFTECLSNNEVLIVTGAERFNNTSGYASTFHWDGPHYDVTPRDPHLRRLSQLVCLDAHNFTRNPSSQYEPYYVMRELKKAFIGYCRLRGCLGIPPAVATGNWGCGAFRGNPILKGLIQLAAAAEAKRDVAYFTFGDEKLRDNLYDMYQFLKSSRVSVGDLVKVLCQYGKNKDVSGNDLAEYIKSSVLSDFNSDTDVEHT